jgi:nucleotide-binding universal stress UspA family protein
MYTRILIALDGSEQAEAILPFAEHVAGPLDAEVVLLRVVEPISPAEALASGGMVTPDAFGLRKLEATRYLNAMAGRLSKKGLRVRTHAAVGSPADEILAAAETVGADLIAMSTHARSGIGHALLGSVAAEVLRRSPAPVLMVRQRASASGGQGAAPAGRPADQRAGGTSGGLGTRTP